MKCVSVESGALEINGRKYDKMNYETKDSDDNE